MDRVDTGVDGGGAVFFRRRRFWRRAAASCSGVDLAIKKGFTDNLWTHAKNPHNKTHFNKKCCGCKGFLLRKVSFVLRCGG